jgi:hypothetical protein
VQTVGHITHAAMQPSAVSAHDRCTAVTPQNDMNKSQYQINTMHYHIYTICHVMLSAGAHPSSSSRHIARASICNMLSKS